MNRKSRYVLCFALAFAGLPLAHGAGDDYGTAVGQKLGSGLSNLTLGWLELPKNVVNTSNETNLAVGVTGGVLKGVLHPLGRTLAGTVDVLSAPFPTKPIVTPPFVWQNFNTETQYNPIFKAPASTAPAPAGY